MWKKRDLCIKTEMTICNAQEPYINTCVSSWHCASTYLTLLELLYSRHFIALNSRHERGNRAKSSGQTRQIRQLWGISFREDCIKAAWGLRLTLPPKVEGQCSQVLTHAIGPQVCRSPRQFVLFRCPLKKNIILSYVSAKPLSLLLKVEVISHFISVSTRTF